MLSLSASNTARLEDIHGYNIIPVGKTSKLGKTTQDRGGHTTENTQELRVGVGYDHEPYDHIRHTRRSHTKPPVGVETTVPVVDIANVFPISMMIFGSTPSFPGGKGDGFYNKVVITGSFSWQAGASLSREMVGNGECIDTKR